LNSHITSTLRVEELAKQETSIKQAQTGYSLAYSSTLKMEAVCSSKMSVDFHWTTWCYNPEDTTLHNDKCENPKSNISWNLPGKTG
jgi:hypothetical protein